MKFIENRKFSSTEYLLTEGDAVVIKFQQKWQFNWLEWLSIQNVRWKLGENSRKKKKEKQ